MAKIELVKKVEAKAWEPYCTLTLSKKEGHILRGILGKMSHGVGENILEELKVYFLDTVGNPFEVYPAESIKNEIDDLYGKDTE